ncbi:MAG: hypothetical protein P4K98_06325 [Bryobacteraceae bacterium]|nr:hypothetical protein [Bryobacteraceae bacterium]
MPTIAQKITRPSSSRRVVLDGYVPVPRGTLASAPEGLSWPAKDPADVLDYELDISPAVAGNENDSIATIDVVIDPGAAGDLSLVSAAADGTTAILWLSGGQAGTVYSVQITIGTTGGRTVARAIYLPVMELLTTVASSSALTSSDSVLLVDQSGNPILVGG